MKTVELVRPSTVDLNDSMDINDYVKILKVPWGELYDSQFIKGTVLKKGVADK
mgnify:CR=1 FL=1